MSASSRCLLVLTLALGALLAACGGGDGAATPSPARRAATSTAEPTTAPSPAAAATPSPTAKPQGAPHAAAPTVPANVTVLDIGQMTLNIAAGGTYPFDPLQLAQNQGVTPPACAAFVFMFAWQVRDPYPADSVNIRFHATQMGHTETIAEDPSGATSTGCGRIEVVNDTAVKITVEIRYGFGEMKG